MDTIQDTFGDLNLEMILESLADLLECGTLVISAEGRAGHGGGDEDAENEELHGEESGVVTVSGLNDETLRPGSLYSLFSLHRC